MTYLRLYLMNFACAAALTFSANVIAKQLDHYSEIKSAVLAGKSIRIIVNYDKCSNTSFRKILGNSYAVYTPNALAIGNNEHIGTYVKYFTLHDSLYPGKPVYEYGNYVITSADSLNISWTILNAADYSELGNTYTTSCKLGDSAFVYTA